MIYLGIDPGITNTGWCLVPDRSLSGVPVIGGVFHPEDHAADLLGTVVNLRSEIQKGCREVGMDIHHVKGAYIERYVAYKGALNSNTEPTLLLIGSLTFSLRLGGITVLSGRAIDWKPKVCKLLFTQQDFRNPSERFDKKFSLAAAKAIAGKEIKPDHVADACCMAYLAREILTIGDTK